MGVLYVCCAFGNTVRLLGYDWMNGWRGGFLKSRLCERGFKNLKRSYSHSWHMQGSSPTYYVHAAAPLTQAQCSK